MKTRVFRKKNVIFTDWDRGGSSNRSVGRATNRDRHHLRVERGRDSLCNRHGDAGTVQERDDGDN